MNIAYEEMPRKIEELLGDIEKLEEEKQQSKDNWNELKKYIEKEKDRLVKGVSHTYEDSLGKINYVNEDIYIKLVKVLNKMYELDKVNNER